LLGMALFSGGQIRPHTVSLINTTAYSFAIFVWIGYALLATTPRAASANTRMSQRWEQGLGDLLNPIGEDSLIPMFERMVDRAFSHSPAETEREQKDQQRSITKTSGTGRAITPIAPRKLPRDLVR
jgi:hypothetical protein